MARDLSNINLIRKTANRNLTALYYPPITKIELEDILKENNMSDYRNLSQQELSNLYDEKIESLGDLNFKTPIEFEYKDGTEDVYTKSGYEHMYFEYAERSFTQKRKFRIQTDEIHIEFMAGGKIEIPGDDPYIVVAVINMTNDISTQNKYRILNSFKRTKHNLEKAYQEAPKIIGLI